MKSIALALGLLLPTAAFSQAPAPVTGRWTVIMDNLGIPIYLVMQIDQDSGAVTGTYGGQKFAGTLAGGVLHLSVKNDRLRIDADAKVVGATMKGELIYTALDGSSAPARYPFSAERSASRPAGPPKHHEFTPTTFYRQFSALNQPALRINPGDSIHTTTVDAGGSDETGRRRVVGGNPQTGPFYVETALPGDTLAVHINRLKLNRSYAESDDAIVPRGLDERLAVQMKDGGKPVRWRLDGDKGMAFIEKPGEHTAAYGVPLRPMLGCIATAPQPVGGAPPAGDSGPYGGNMDFNEIVEGATVYLPVFVPGALLYFGDAHALQGDGEINGNALETSMDVEVTVDVIPGKGLPAPRVESDTHIMAMGLAGSIDDAYRAATSNLAAWLSRDYGLSPAEVAEVIGTAAEYRISEVADRNAGVVAKISKARLAGLAPRSIN